MNIKSRVALVTGGALRIGRAVCTALADKGCTVAVHYNRSADDARELVERLGSKGCSAFAVQGDLRSKDECSRVIDKVYETAGRLDILVNNAAVFHKDTLLSADGDKLSREVDLNFLVPVQLSQAFARLYGESVCCNEDGAEAGRIVNLLDMRIMRVDEESLPYSVSKKMLAEYTRESALLFAPGITVNGVAPGSILPPPKVDGKREKESAGANPLSCRCTPEDVASAVVFLVEADTVTGQIIFVDGGQHLGRIYE
ncbi:MAG: SDR family oxidoreductase [Kiritimatiellae bacterium]|nr:SDR family oxidoreductase [Kiritimatiellia bacterium]